MTPKYLDPLRILSGIGRRAETLMSRRAVRRRHSVARNAISRNRTPFNVNVGCGREPFEGWINLDLDSESRADILWDVTDGLPFPDHSCAFIYSEHFLEHIPVHAGVLFLRECYRCLRPGGVIRVGMPSIEDTIRHYYEGTWSQQAWLEKYGHGWIKTRAEYANICFRDWGHQWLYDSEELARRLREAGFSRVNDVGWRESTYQELRNRETRVETTLLCEAIK